MNKDIRRLLLNGENIPITDGHLIPVHTVADRCARICFSSTKFNSELYMDDSKVKLTTFYCTCDDGTTYSGTAFLQSFLETEKGRVVYHDVVFDPCRLSPYVETTY